MAVVQRPGQERVKDAVVQVAPRSEPLTGLWARRRRGDEEVESHKDNGY